jgi:hypothetical protein
MQARGLQRDPLVPHAHSQRPVIALAIFHFVQEFTTIHSRMSRLGSFFEILVSTCRSSVRVFVGRVCWITGKVTVCICYCRVFSLAETGRTMLLLS